MAGHILRLPSRRPSKVAMSWPPDDGRRRIGRPKKTWRRTFQEDLTRANITREEAEHTAMDRPVWRQAAAQCEILAWEELSLNDFRSYVTVF